MAWPVGPAWADSLVSLERLVAGVLALLLASYRLLDEVSAFALDES